MEFSKPREFEEMRRLEGNKSINDIWDIDTYDDIKNEIEKASSNIKELVENKELTEETEGCLNKAREFCSDLSEDFKQKFTDLLDEYRSNQRQLSQKIIDYLLEKKFDLPNFTIAHGRQASELLKDLGFNNEIQDNNLLLVLQLPKPLSQFWWKGGGDSWGSAAKDAEGTVEWGHFYRELMPVVWGQHGYYEDERGLNFDRINDLGEHNPKKYYYIWEMSQWGGRDEDEDKYNDDEN